MPDNKELMRDWVRNWMWIGPILDEEKRRREWNRSIDEGTCPDPNAERLPTGLSEIELQIHGRTKTMEETWPSIYGKPLE